MKIRHSHCVAILHPSGISTSNVKIAQKACVFGGALDEENEKMNEHFEKMDEENQKTDDFNPLSATRHPKPLKTQKISLPYATRLQ